MAVVFPKLTTGDRYFYWFLRHSYRGGRDYVYPPSSTVHPDRGRVVRRVEGLSTSDGATEDESVGGSSYLLAHGRESSADYESRRRLAYPIRICAPIVHEYVSTILRPRTERTIAAELEEANANTDGRGGNVSSFRERVLRWALVYGVAWVGQHAVAAERVTQGDKPTLADVGSDRVRSSIVAPQNILWWSRNESGETVGLLVDEGVESVSSSPFEKSSTSLLRMRLYTPEKVTRYEAELQSATAESATYGVHRIGALKEVGADDGPGFVPFAPCVFRRAEDADDVCGESLIEGAADIQHDVFNHLSWIQSIHRDQGFPVLAVPYELSAGKVAQQTQIALGTKRALGFQIGAQPVFLSPPTEQAIEMREYISEAIERARTDAGVGRRSDSAQVASGTAEGWQHAPFFANCKGGAEMMTAWETAWNAQRLAILRGTTPDQINPAECRAQYGTDFEPADLDRVVERLDKVLGVGIGGVFDREMKRTTARVLLAEQTDDIRNEVDADIVERSTRESEATAALDNKIIAEGNAPPAPAFGTPRFGRPKPPPAASGPAPKAA